MSPGAQNDTKSDPRMTIRGNGHVQESMNGLPESVDILIVGAGIYARRRPPISEELRSSAGRESIEERRRLLQVAPHLVRPLRCRLDLSPLSIASRLLFRAGLLGNAWFTRRCNEGVATSAHLPRSRYPCWL